MNNTIYKVGAYIRLSREDNNKFEESNSITNQRELIKQYIEKENDLSIYKYYADDGKTGTNFDRPGFQMMMKDMYDKKINCIIVKDLSRFGRNYIEVGRYIDYIFPSLNLRFISINDNIDNYKNPEVFNNVLIPFKNLMNDEYCRDISRKVKKVKEIQRINGEVTNGACPYGYIKEGKKYVIDEEAANIVRLIFDLCIAGESNPKIAFKLNDEGIDCPRVYLYKKKYNKDLTGKYYWNAGPINNILKNETYCGDLIQGKTRTLNNKIKVSIRVPKEEWITVRDTHDSIIDRETFKKAQDCLNSRCTAKNNIKNNKYNSIFKGYLRCFDCDRKLVKHSCHKLKDRVYMEYECMTHIRISKKLCNSHRIKHSELYNIVLNQMKADIQNLIEQEKNLFNDVEQQELINKVKKEIEEENFKINEIVKLKNGVLQDLKKKLITIEDYQFYINSYEEQIGSTNKRLNDLKDKEFKLTQEEKMIKNYIDKFSKYLNMNNLTEDVLKELVNTIYLKEDKTIVIKYIDDDIYKMILNKKEE